MLRFSMVTEAGKELLRNTINTAKFHNRILEENEMWKQWELERGLTMMVSDDLILSRTKKHHQCSKHRKRSKSRSKERPDKSSGDVNIAGSSKDVIDRWDHNGFRELYPDETDSGIYNSPASRNSGKKWDHSGYLELYPEEANKDKNVSLKSKEHSKKEKKRHKEHHSNASTSDNEIWEDFKMYKRSKVAKKSKSHDSHIKEWKRQVKREHQ